MAENIDDVEKRRRNRKPTWTYKETRVLVAEFEKHREVLRPTAENASSIRLNQKHAAWSEICKVVNMANPFVHRTVPEVQKKWQNLCLLTKKDLNIKGPRELQHYCRNEVESVVIRDLVAPAIGMSVGDDSSNDVIVKIENLEEIDETGGAESPDFGQRAETTDSSDQEASRSENSNNVYPLDDYVPRDPRNMQNSYVSRDTEDLNNSYPSPSFEHLNNHTISGENHNEASERGLKRKYSETFNEKEQSCSSLYMLKKRKLLFDIKKSNCECEKLQIEKEKLIIEKEKMALERDKIAIELKILQSSLQKQQQETFVTKPEMPPVFGNRDAHVQNELPINQSVKDKAYLERERIQLENEKLKLELKMLMNSQNVGNK